MFFARQYLSEPVKIPTLSAYLFFVRLCEYQNLNIKNKLSVHLDVGITVSTDYFRPTKKEGMIEKKFTGRRLKSKTSRKVTKNITIWKYSIFRKRRGHFEALFQETAYVFSKMPSGYRV